MELIKLYVGSIQACFKEGNKIKGVILAGGTGSRLSPTTDVTNKHLLPVYDKPMIYYPIETLINAGIEEILIITGPDHAGDFMRLLGSGKGMKFDATFKIQDTADGIAGALLLAKDFILPDKQFVVMLGDNIFTHGLKDEIDAYVAKSKIFMNTWSGARAGIVLTEVKNPEEFGVVTVNDNAEVVKIIEKPSEPESNMIATGAYFYPNDVFFMISALDKSTRGEFEVSELNQMFVDAGRMLSFVYQYGWYDAGSHDSILKASNALQKLKNSIKMINIHNGI